MLAAKFAGVLLAERGVITTTALGDIVEQRGKIQAFGLDQTLHQFARKRELMAEFRHREAAHVTQYEQRVLVDSVDVKQIMLHLANHTTEGRQVGAEHAIGVHAPKLVGDTARLAQDLHEQAAAGEVAAEFGVDTAQVRTHQADGAGAHALDVGVLLQHQEQFQQRERVALKRLRVGYLEKTVARLEAAIDRFNACPRRRKNFLLKML